LIRNFLINAHVALIYCRRSYRREGPKWQATGSCAHTAIRYRVDGVHNENAAKHTQIDARAPGCPRCSNHRITWVESRPLSIASRFPVYSHAPLRGIIEAYPHLMSLWQDLIPVAQRIRGSLWTDLLQIVTRALITQVDKCTRD
jgi:hypothetical protein